MICLVQFISHFALILSTLVFKPHEYSGLDQRHMAWIYHLTKISTSLDERKLSRKRPVCPARCGVEVFACISMRHFRTAPPSNGWWRWWWWGRALLKNSSCHINFAIFAPEKQVRIQPEHRAAAERRARRRQKEKSRSFNWSLIDQVRMRTCSYLDPILNVLEEMALTAGAPDLTWRFSFQYKTRKSNNPMFLYFFLLLKIKKMTIAKKTIFYFFSHFID